jgi:hypothetical protein
LTTAFFTSFPEAVAVSFSLVKQVTDCGKLAKFAAAATPPNATRLKIVDINFMICNELVFLSTQYCQMF